MGHPLAQYESEHKELLCRLIARGHEVSDAMDQLQEFYPEVHRYHLDTIRKWLITEEGLDRREKATSKIRAQAKTKLYAHSGSRIDALNEVLQKIFTQIRKIDAEKRTRDFTALCAEARQTLESMRREVDPMGVGDTEFLSPVQAFFIKANETLEDLEKQGKKEKILN